MEITTTYSVYCVKDAYDEWQNLNNSVRLQFVKKLKKLLINPRIENNRLRGELSDCYKIKLLRAGFRLVYQVIDEKVILLIWAVNKREKEVVYSQASKRLLDEQSDEPIKLDI